MSSRPGELQESAEVLRFFKVLRGFTTVLTAKLYRLKIELPPNIPVLPCLDHEAMLHEGIARHAAAYVQFPGADDLHEVVVTPAERRIDVDVTATHGEHSDEAHRQLLERLRREFPGHSIRVKGFSHLRGEPRVHAACRAQVRLRDVLVGDDLDATEAAVKRLNTISGLMEKESRVASWSVRTVTAPALALTGWLTYELLGLLAPKLGATVVDWLRWGVMGLLGTFFVYYGLKAVQLTEMANRVWKRSAEYGLILAERRRRQRSG